MVSEEKMFENVDRRTDDEFTGILIAHLGAFGSGELTNKGNEAICGCFVTQYNSSISRFVPNFRIRSQLVVEKSLTEKKLTNRQPNRQTNTITEKAKTIYPYIVRTGSIKMSTCIIYLKVYTKFENTGSYNRS